MTAPKPLTRKVGPLPVYGWVALALILFLLYRHVSSASGATSQQTPVTPNVGSAAQQPASGQGTAADNVDSGLLDALNANSAAYDKLLAALQYGTSATSGGGSNGGVPSGFGAAGGGTNATTAPTVSDVGVDPVTSLVAAPIEPSYFGAGTSSYGTAPPVDMNGNTYVGAYVGPPSPGITAPAVYALSTDTTIVGKPTPASSPDAQAALAYATKTNTPVAV